MLRKEIINLIISITGLEAKSFFCDKKKNGVRKRGGGRGNKISGGKGGDFSLRQLFIRVGGDVREEGGEVFHEDMMFLFMMEDQE